MIASGEMLTDNRINFAQQILKMQFHNLTGLQSTLVLSKHQKLSATSQYLHLHSSLKVLQVFDSLYSFADGMTMKLITKLFGLEIVLLLRWETVHSRMVLQIGGSLQIATYAALASHRQPEKKVVQEKMRDHLHVHVVKWFKNFSLTAFPC